MQPGERRKERVKRRRERKTFFWTPNKWKSTVSPSKGRKQVSILFHFSLSLSLSLLLTVFLSQLLRF
jgi:hypothetical protein